MGIGEILPRSDVLGLEDEATVPGVPCSILRSVASAKAVKTHRGVGGDFADAGEGNNNFALAVPYCVSLHQEAKRREIKAE